MANIIGQEMDVIIFQEKEGIRMGSTNVSHSRSVREYKSIGEQI